MKTNTKGWMSKPMLFFFGMLVTALAIGAMWAPDKRNEESSEGRRAPVRLSESTDPVTEGQRYSVTIPVGASEKGEAGDLWKAFAEVSGSSEWPPRKTQGSRSGASLSRSSIR